MCYSSPCLTMIILVNVVSFYRNCRAASVGVLQDNLVLSTGLTMWISLWREIWKLMFRALARHRSESRNCGLCGLYTERWSYAYYWLIIVVPLITLMVPLLMSTNVFIFPNHFLGYFVHHCPKGTQNSMTALLFNSLMFKTWLKTIHRTTSIIIWCIFLFLSNSQEPTTWPANDMTACKKWSAHV